LDAANERAGRLPACAARQVWLVALGALAWQGLLALRTPVPSEDGVCYLWMAQQFAAGEWSQALSMVFPPGFPLLLAPWLALGLPAEPVGIVCGALCVAMTLVPLARIAESYRAGAGLPAAVLFAASPLLGRVAVEVYSEPPFLLLMAWGTWFGLRSRWWGLGLCAGLAFWIRPEGLLLAFAFVLAARGPALRALLPAALAVLLLALLRWLAGHGFDPLPILSFHEQRDDLSGRGDLLGNLLLVPGAWLEAYGLAGLLPVVLLVPTVRRRAPTTTPAALWWQIVLQVAVVCTFVVRRRFLLSAAVPVAALGGMALASLPRIFCRSLLVLCTATGLVIGFLGTIESDRTAERQIGEYLATRLQPGSTVTGDLTRVLWFAGQRPLPPRHFDGPQLAAMAAPANVQFVVISDRSQRAASQQVLPLLAADFERLQLPESLARLADQRGLAVFARR